MDLPDLTALNAEDLYELRVATTRESDRRDILARAPDDAALLARRYVTAGGDLADLHAALDAATDPEGA